jgi:hypothetical protein
MRPLARGLAALTLGMAIACQSAPREQSEAVTVDTMAGVTPAVAPVPPTPAPTPTTTSPTTTPSSTAAPAILALVPDSLRLAPNTISEMLVRGSGFSPSGANTVRIGPITLTSVASNATGTEVRVTVPTRYSTNAEAPPRPLFPGDYPVTVETGGKTSNSKTLKVLP